MRSLTEPFCLRTLTLAVLIPLSAAPPGCSSGDGDGGEPQPATPVIELTSRADLLDATGEAAFESRQLLSVRDGRALVFDGVSESVLLIQQNGVPLVFTSGDSLRALTGKATVDLGAMIQILTQNATLEGQILAADGESGKMIRLSGTGVPSIFSSDAQITLATGQASYRMSLPRELTINQIIAQDLVTKSLLRFDPNGNALLFVSGLALANAAQIPTGSADVAGWVRGPLTLNQYARFGATNNIVSITTAGQTSLYVSGANLNALFPQVANLNIIDMIAEPGTERLLLLMGSGTRGVALAIVSANGSSVSVFTSQALLESVAGASVDLSDLELLLQGVAAVDRGGVQVLTFLSNGTPVIVGSRADIEAAAGTQSPQLDSAAAFRREGALLPEAEGESLLFVDF